MIFIIKDKFILVKPFITTIKKNNINNNNSVLSFINSVKRVWK